MSKSVDNKRQRHTVKVKVRTFGVIMQLAFTSIQYHNDKSVFEKDLRG